MSIILEELEDYGSIVIMDKEDDSYCIFTDKPYKVQKILKRHEVDFTSEPMYNKAEGKKQSWCFDFNLRGPSK